MRGADHLTPDNRAIANRLHSMTFVPSPATILLDSLCPSFHTEKQRGMPALQPFPFVLPPDPRIGARCSLRILTALQLAAGHTRYPLPAASSSEATRIDRLSNTREGDPPGSR